MFTIQSNSIQTIKENIMTYFNGTLQEFTYLHEQVTEISNPDESYLGTLNLFFKEPVTSNDEQTYFEESDAFEQYVKDYINNNIIQLQELNGNGHYIANDNGDTIQVHFNDYFKPDYYYEISVTDVEGYAPTFIEYYTWDEDKDGPIPGIKLFKDLNIYLEREYCEY